MCLAFKHINIKINNTPHMYICMYIYLRYELAASTWTQNYIQVAILLYICTWVRDSNCDQQFSINHYRIIQLRRRATKQRTQRRQITRERTRGGGGGGAYATIRRAIDERILIIIIVRDGDMVLLLMPLQFTKEEPI